MVSEEGIVKKYHLDSLARGVVRLTKVLKQRLPNFIIVPLRGGFPVYKLVFECLRLMGVKASQYDPPVLMIPQSASAEDKGFERLELLSSKRIAFFDEVVAGACISFTVSGSIPILDSAVRVRTLMSLPFYMNIAGIKSVDYFVIKQRTNMESFLGIMASVATSAGQPHKFSFEQEGSSLRFSLVFDVSKMFLLDVLHSLYEFGLKRRGGKKQCKNIMKKLILSLNYHGIETPAFYKKRTKLLRREKEVKEPMYMKKFVGKKFLLLDITKRCVRAFGWNYLLSEREGYKEKDIKLLIGLIKKLDTNKSFLVWKTLFETLTDNKEIKLLFYYSYNLHNNDSSVTSFTKVILGRGFKKIKTRMKKLKPMPVKVNFFVEIVKQNVFADNDALIPLVKNFSKGLHVVPASLIYRKELVKKANDFRTRIYSALKNELLKALNKK